MLLDPIILEVFKVLQTSRYYFIANKLSHFLVLTKLNSFLLPPPVKTPVSCCL